MSEPLITKPIFILGAPRSGTSLMRHLLERGDDGWTYGREGTTVWESERPHTLHPRRRHWHSNRLDQSDATPEVAASLRQAMVDATRMPGADWTTAEKLDHLEFLYPQGVQVPYYDVDWAALTGRLPGPIPEGPPGGVDIGETGETPPFALPPRGRRPTAVERARGLRVLEKNNRSTFRIPFLRRVFPDAKYVFVVRDPKECIGSIMSAWLHPRSFFTYKVPNTLRIAGYSDVYPWGQHWWKLSLFPGWRELLDSPLPEVCAGLWRAANTALIDEGSSLVERGDGVFVRYEDLCRDPAAQLRRVAEVVELSFDFTSAGDELPVVVTEDPPNSDKWLRHEKAVRSVLPRVGEVAHVLGY